MVEESGDYQVENVEEESSHEKVTGGFLQSIGDIFVDPVKVFRRIDAGMAWWKAFVLISVISIVLARLMQPFNRHVMLLNERGLGEEQLEQAISSMERFGIIGLVLVPIFVIIMLVIIAGIAHLMINLISSVSSFKKTLGLCAYCGIISMVGQIIAVAILAMRGVESIESSADMRISLNLSVLFPDLEGFWNALVESLGLFEIWYYVLILIGISTIFKVKRPKALVPVIAIWIISLILIFLRNIFGGGMG